MILDIDLALWTLVLLLNVTGVWIARAGWKDKVIPTTVILGLISIFMATVWGYMCAYGDIVHYGLPNGILAWIVCTQLYDVVHESFVKRKEWWMNLFNAIKKFFQKEGKQLKISSIGFIHYAELSRFWHYLYL